MKARREVSTIKDAAVPKMLRKLRRRKNMPEQEMIEIYSTFQRNITSEPQLVEVTVVCARVFNLGRVLCALVCACVCA